MMRVVDILYALPFMFFAILLMVFLGRHLVLIFVAIGAINWLDMARIVRGQTLSLEASRVRRGRRSARRLGRRDHPPPHRAEPARNRRGLCDV